MMQPPSTRSRNTVCFNSNPLIETVQEAISQQRWRHSESKQYRHSEKKHANAAWKARPTKQRHSQYNRDEFVHLLKKRFIRNQGRLDHNKKTIIDNVKYRPTEAQNARKGETTRVAALKYDLDDLYHNTPQFYEVMTFDNCEKASNEHNCLAKCLSKAILKPKSKVDQCFQQIFWDNLTKYRDHKKTDFRYDIGTRFPMQIKKLNFAEYMKINSEKHYEKEVVAKKNKLNPKLNWLDQNSNKDSSPAQQTASLRKMENLKIHEETSLNATPFSQLTRLSK